MGKNKEPATRFGKKYFSSLSEVMGESACPDSADIPKWFPEKVISAIMGLPKNGKLLDVGAGAGSFLRMVAKMRPDLKLYAVDVWDSRELLPKNVSFKVGGGDKLPFKSEFDMISIIHVIEHIREPHPFFTEAHRCLKEDGKLLVITPYYQSLFLPDSPMNFWQDPTHIRPHTKISLSRLFYEAQFRNWDLALEKTKWASILLAPYLFLKYLVLGDSVALATVCMVTLKPSILGIGTK